MALLTFNLHNEVLGDLGIVEALTVGENRTAVSTRMPPLFNEDYQAALQGKHGDEMSELKLKWGGRNKNATRLCGAVWAVEGSNLRPHGCQECEANGEPLCTRRRF